MTLRGLVKLARKDFLSPVLKARWEDKHKINLWEEIGEFTKDSRRWKILFATSILLFLCSLAGLAFFFFPAEQIDWLKIVVLVGFSYSVAVSVILFRVSAAALVLLCEEETSAHRFAAYLSKFVLWCDLSIEDFRYKLLPELRDLAEGVIIKQSSMILLLEGLNENMPFDTPNLVKAREEFKSKHKVLHELGLVDEKWDKFFTAAKVLRQESKQET